jgi:hypothetical protein
VLYHYKRPDDWLWTPWETSSLEEDARSGNLHPDWRFRIDGDSQDYTLAELIEKERASKPVKAPDAAEAELLAPDGTWGVIIVVLSLAYISLLLFVPTQKGSSGLRFTLVGLALVWMGSGIRKIKAARAWKRHHSHKT